MMTQAHQYVRIYGDGSRKQLDKFFLLAAFLLGTVGGAFLKFLHVNPIIPALYSALILVLYAIFCYRATSLTLDAEVIGDNCYYLGFLFTLTSLSVTLYFVVSADATSRADLIPEVISGFGVALSSTIVGVFLRVMMMQFRLDLVVREKETRVVLDTAARDLKEEIVRSIDHFKAFSIESVQKASEREEAMGRVAAELFDNMQQSFLKVSSTFLEEIQAAVKEQSQEAVQQIRIAVSTSSDAAVRGLAEGLDKVAQSTEQMKLANQRINRAFVKSIDYVEKTSEALGGKVETLIRASDKLNQHLILMTETTNTAMSGFSSQLSAASQEFLGGFQEGANSFGASWGNALRDISHVSTAFQEIKQSCASMSGTLLEATSALSSGVFEVEQSFKSLENVSERANADIRTLLSSNQAIITSTTDEWEAAGKVLSARVSQSASQIASSLEHLNSAVNELVGRVHATAPGGVEIKSVRGAGDSVQLGLTAETVALDTSGGPSRDSDEDKAIELRSELAANVSDSDAVVPLLEESSTSIPDSSSMSNGVLLSVPRASST